MGWLPVPNPIAFTIAGISIRWYAICLTTGMVLGLLFAYYRAPKKNLNPDRLIDYFVWCAPAGIIGARAYYVIFQWDMYKNNLKQIFNFRGGGLAIHGTIIAVAIVLFFATRHYKDDLLTWIELTIPSWPLGQAIGRWGNYFNSEAHGVATDLPWAIYADGEWVHPTFLYESLWCFLLFIFLLWWDSKGHTKFKGQLLCFYMIFYSLERFFVEGLRTDSLYIGSLRQAQVISVVAFVTGIILYFVFKKRNAQSKMQEENVNNDVQVE